MQEYIRKASGFINEATAFDGAGDYGRAFSSYMSALDWFEMAYKYAPTERMRQQLGTRMRPYVQRAELLKEQIARDAEMMALPPSQPYDMLSSSSNNNNNAGDGDKKEDVELKRAISAAILSEKPTLRLKDVAGLEAAKQALKEAVIVPFQAPQLWEKGESSWSGILLYGPPGTGKSFLAKAIAGEADCTFFSVSASDLLSKWVGQSEKLIKTVFEMARQQQPAIIFVDEVESVLASRSADGGSASAHADRVVTEFLIQMDGVGKQNQNVLFLGATNLPWLIDMGARRRLERKIYIPLPDAEARRQMLARGIGDKLSAEVVDDLVQATEGYSGSDIASLLKDALMAPRRRVMSATHFKPLPFGVDGECLYMPCTADEARATEGCIQSTFDAFEHKRRLKNPPMEPDDFYKALEHISATVDPATLARYEEWTHLYGSE